MTRVGINILHADQRKRNGENEAAGEIDSQQIEKAGGSHRSLVAMITQMPVWQGAALLARRGLAQVRRHARIDANHLL